jgi:predicted  nucleic acid-binding Zn-ribbon protein
VFSRVGAYLKTAFTTRWNLLLFGGGVAAAFISGFPGIVLPLVLAGEVYYLASMLANERFRSAVEAQDAKARRAAEALGAREAYERIRKNLPPALLKRFDQLRDHCLKLVELGGSIRGPDGSGPDKTALESLDRLLWGYLRMIWGASTLSDFLDHTDDGAIRARIADLERRLAKLPKDDTGSVQMRTALEDHLKTSRERLDNIDEARRKLDLVAAEIERLEAKIAALAESSVAKRDVTDIAQRVDEVAEGMRKTDETMRQLQLPPELEDLDEPPAMLREEA